MVNIYIIKINLINIYNYRYFDIYFKESIKIFNTPLDNRIQLMNELHNILILMKLLIY